MWKSALKRLRYPHWLRYSCAQHPHHQGGSPHRVVGQHGGGAAVVLDLTLNLFSVVEANPNTNDLGPSVIGD